MKFQITMLNAIFMTCFLFFPGSTLVAMDYGLTEEELELKWAIEKQKEASPLGNKSSSDDSDSDDIAPEEAEAIQDPFEAAKQLIDNEFAAINKKSPQMQWEHLRMLAQFAFNAEQLYVTYILSCLACEQGIDTETESHIIKTCYTAYPEISKILSDCQSDLFYSIDACLKKNGNHFNFLDLFTFIEEKKRNADIIQKTFQSIAMEHKKQIEIASNLLISNTESLIKKKTINITELKKMLNDKANKKKFTSINQQISQEDRIIDELSSLISAAKNVSRFFNGLELAHKGMGKYLFFEEHQLKKLLDTEQSLSKNIAILKRLSNQYNDLVFSSNSFIQKIISQADAATKKIDLCRQEIALSETLLKKFEASKIVTMLIDQTKKLRDIYCYAYEQAVKKLAALPIGPSFDPDSAISPLSKTIFFLDSLIESNDIARITKLYNILQFHAQYPNQLKDALPEAYSQNTVDTENNAIIKKMHDFQIRRHNDTAKLATDMADPLLTDQIIHLNQWVYYVQYKMDGISKALGSFVTQDENSTVTFFSTTPPCSFNNVAPFFKKYFSHYTRDLNKFFNPTFLFYAQRTQNRLKELNTPITKKSKAMQPTELNFPIIPTRPASQKPKTEKKAKKKEFQLPAVIEPIEADLPEKIDPEPTLQSQPETPDIESDASASEEDVATTPEGESLVQIADNLRNMIKKNNILVKTTDRLVVEQQWGVGYKQNMLIALFPIARNSDQFIKEKFATTAPEALIQKAKNSVHLRTKGQKIAGNIRKEDIDAWHNISYHADELLLHGKIITPAMTSDGRLQVVDNDPTSLINLSNLKKDTVAMAVPIKIFCPIQENDIQTARACTQKDRPAGSRSGALVWIWNSGTGQFTHRFFHEYVRGSDI